MKQTATTRSLPRALLTLLLAAGGCSGTPDPPDPPDAPDLLTDESDLRAPPRDMAGARCELPYDQRAINKVSEGAVTVMAPLPMDPQIYTAQIDATAGGSGVSQDRPYVYLDLVNRTKVDLTDVQSRDSAGWDVAFKRWQIKINSGDSGPGGVTVSVVKGKRLEEVTAAPGGAYVEDDYLDESCMVYLDPIGGLATALSGWYDYNNTKLTPWNDTYVLKRRDGMGAIKLQIVSYYDMAGNSARYTIRWGLLP